MGRLVWGIVALAAATATAPAADPLNVDFSVGWGGHFRPSEWAPVEIGIASNLKEPLGGTVSLTCRQDSLCSIQIHHPFVVTADMPVRLPLVTKIAFANGSFDLAIHNNSGRRVWQYEYPADFSNKQYIPVRVDDVLIGISGRRGAGLGRLGQYASAKRGKQSGPGKVYVGDKLPQLLPWDWTGYACLDVLVLYDIEWDRMNAHQAAAITEWVSNGGKLLLVLGSRPLEAKCPLAAILPAAIAPPRDAKPLKAFKGGQATLAAWGIRELAAAPRWSSKSMNSEEKTLARGSFGFGKVAVLAYDPEQLGEPTPEESQEFWAACLSPLAGEILEKKNQHDTSYDHMYYDQAGSDRKATNTILETLLDIPEMRPLHMGWVVGVLAALAVLLGPVDYLVLKRMDRLPMTWITSAAIIAVFTVGSYYGVAALRSGATQLRSVTVVDGVAGERAWATNYSGIFASTSDDYRLDGLSQRQWWSALSPSRDEYRYMTESFDRKIYCMQKDGGNLPVSLPVNIWSIQCLMGQWPVEKLPISAELRPGGDGGFTLKLTNRSKIRMDGGFVMASDRRYGGIVKWRSLRDGIKGSNSEAPRTIADRPDIKFANLAPLEAGQSVEITGSYVLPPGANAAAQWAGLLGNPQSDLWFSSGVAERTRTVLRMLDEGAVAVCGSFAGAAAPYDIANARHSVKNIEFVRLTVFPQAGDQQEGDASVAGGN